MDIVLTVPDNDLLDIELITDVNLDKSREEVRNRLKLVETTRDKFYDYVKVYMDEEDQKWKDIKKSCLDAKQKLASLEGSMKQQIEKNELTKLTNDLELKQKEWNEIESKIMAIQQKKTNSAEEQKKSIQKLIDQTQLLDCDTLKLIEDPNPTNKSGIVFNWIMGCLYAQKVGIVKFCEALKIPLEKPQKIIAPPPPKPAKGLCGGGQKKSSKQPESEIQIIELPDEHYAWIALKKFLFQQNGKELKKQLNDVAKQDEDLKVHISFKPFQIMLTEELIYEKKEILKMIYDINVKDQVRAFIEIIEIIQHLIDLNKLLQDLENDKQETVVLNNQKAKIGYEIASIKKQISVLNQKVQCIKLLQATVASIMHELEMEAQRMDQNCENNDKEIDNIKTNSQILADRIQIEVEQEKQKYMAKKKKEFEDAQKRLQEIEAAKKSAVEPAQNQKANDDVQVIQFEEDNQFKQEQRPEEVQQGNDDDVNDDDDDNEKGNLELGDDQILNNIYQTMYPHLIKRENKQQTQTAKKGTVLGNLINRKK
ncbi:hypothetical protein pb186bvf_020407 [Paramecium bursaria]